MCSRSLSLFSIASRICRSSHQCKQVRFSSRIVDADSMLYSTNISFVGGKRKETITLDAIYQDSNPQGLSRATVVALHGAPGSHNDFKYMLPLLQKKDIRLIAVNFPGHGFTKNDLRLTWENEERNNYVQAVVDSLKLTEHSSPLIILGHSRGGENALQIAVANQSSVRGLVMLNSPGLRVHRGIQPVWHIMTIIKLAEIRILNYLLRPLMKYVYNNVFGLRVPSGEVAVCSMFSLRTFAFEKQRPLAKVVASHPSMCFLYAYGGDDFLIEKENAEELALSFDGIRQLTCSTLKCPSDDAAVTSSATELLLSGNRLISAYFEKEGHFLQKFRANFVVEAIEAMVLAPHQRRN